MRAKILLLSAVGVALLAPFASRASSQGESLRDDVFAMIATTQIMNTFFVIDTSEQTNAFAYSGYIDSCADAKSKVDKSLSICWQAYNDCTETNANLMCGASLDCSSTLQKCQTLESNKVKLSTFCALVEADTRYKEPSQTVPSAATCDLSGNPNSKACRFIGPWNPTKTYEHDLCFYDWDVDSGADIPNSDDYSYSQYPNCVDDGTGNCLKDLPDRRDWLCLSDDGTPVTRSGMWLNWRFATSLDAIKILLTDDHRFSYTPRRRGDTNYHCYERTWTATGDGDQCWEYLNYSSLISAAQKADFRALVKQNWLTDTTGNLLCEAETDPTLKEQCCNALFAARDPEESPVCSQESPTCPDTNPPDGTPDNAGCQQCFDRTNTPVACDEEQYDHYTNQPTDPAPLDMTVSNLRSNCRVFHCSAPRCRDDVETHCYAGIDPDPSCPLGFYSEWDQDPEHCCSPVGDPSLCDPLTEFCCVEEGGASSGSFMPGPGATTYVDKEADFPMTALGANDFYSLVELDAGATTAVACVNDADCTGHPDAHSFCDTSAATPICVTGSSWRLTVLPTVDRLKNVRVEMFYGCQGGAAKEKFYEGLYSADTIELLPYAVPLTGCDTKGYKIRVRFYLTHKNDTDGFASAQLEVQMRLTYTKVTPSVLPVFNPDPPLPMQYNFIGGSWEPVVSGPSTIVKEFECESTFYRMRSKVVGGGGGSCDTPQCDSPGCSLPYNPSCLLTGNCPLPYPGCTNKDVTAIAKDQWGSATKSLCSWLCPDAPEYDDAWKCLGYFEANDMEPYPNGGTGPNGDASSFDAFLAKDIENVACKQGIHSIFECCATLREFSGYYEVLKTFDTNHYGDLTGSGKSGDFKCGMAHFQEGIANNQKRKTAGISVQITRGHINEVPGGGSYLLSDAFTKPFVNPDVGVGDPAYWSPTPYVGTDKWYSQYTLPSYGSSAIAASNIFVFRTGENGTREPACIYNIVQDLYGEDCDTCGMGCCMMDMGNIDYCDFPVFWIKVAKTEGGNLVLPLPKNHPLNVGLPEEVPPVPAVEEEPSPLVGNPLRLFQKRVRDLRGVGGATIGETLYDVWRYLGGLQPAYTDQNYFTRYTSPIRVQPRCFINNAVIMSSGQPNFDSNATMDGQNYTAVAPLGTCDPTQPPTEPPAQCQPYVSEVHSWTDDEGHTYAEPYSTETPPENAPYYAINWYASALPRVAKFIHSYDAFHDDAACRTSDPGNYRFGFSAAPCDPGTDQSGANLINRVDTVGIGAWALAPLYSLAGNETGYLDADDTMVATAQAGGGKFYSLTVGSTISNPNEESFVNLAQVFNALSAQFPGTFAVGKPHWTSSPLQPLGKYQETMNNVAFIPGTIPITQRVSRFWFGNLKKYYMWRAIGGQTCVLGESNLLASLNCEWQSFDDNDLLDDCFNPAVGAVSGDQASSTLELNKVLSGGVAANLAAQLETCGVRPCYNKASGRTIYTDVAGSLVNFNTIDPADLDFGGASQDDAITIIDYVYGYDSVDHDGDTNKTEFRAPSSKGEHLASVTMSDPFADPDAYANPQDIPKIILPYSILGAAIHSKPLGIYYDSVTEANLRIHYAANDGLLHCFDGVEGAGSANEKWAYMPSQVRGEMSFILAGLDAVSFNSTMDGPLTLFHIDNNPTDGIINGNEKAYLIIGYRRGLSTGSGYTVLDISVKDSPVYVQHIPTEGQSWSKPTLFTMGGAYYLAFGGGYDSCLDDDLPSCALPTMGSQIHIYRYTGVSCTPPNCFATERTFTVADSTWLTASVVAEAVAVNTTGPLFVKSGGIYTGSTEMIYFVDVTGTIFRVDKDSGSWAIQAIMRMRDTEGTINFGDDGSGGTDDGIKSYYSFLPAPLYEQFLKVQVNGNGDSDLGDPEDVFLVPVPLVTGNIVFPGEQDLRYELVVLYDRRPNGALALPASPDPTVPARYPTGFLDMTLRTTAHSYFDGTQDYDHLFRGYYIALSTTTGVTNDEEKGMSAPLVYYNWDYDIYSIFATTYIPDLTADECSNRGTSYLYCRNLSTGDTLQLDERYEKCMTCNVIGLGEGLAQTPQVLKGDRQPNDEVVAVSVGAKVKTESKELPPPPKTVKILKWYELY